MSKHIAFSALAGLSGALILSSCTTGHDDARYTMVMPSGNYGAGGPGKANRNYRNGGAAPKSNRSSYQTLPKGTKLAAGSGSGFINPAQYQGAYYDPGRDVYYDGGGSEVYAQYGDDYYSPPIFYTKTYLGNGRYQTTYCPPNYVPAAYHSGHRLVSYGNRHGVKPLKNRKQDNPAFSRRFENPLLASTPRRSTLGNSRDRNRHGSTSALPAVPSTIRRQMFTSNRSTPRSFGPGATRDTRSSSAFARTPQSNGTTGNTRSILVSDPRAARGPLASTPLPAPQQNANRASSNANTVSYAKPNPGRARGNNNPRRQAAAAKQPAPAAAARQRNAPPRSASRPAVRPTPARVSPRPAPARAAPVRAAPVRGKPSIRRAASSKSQTSSSKSSQSRGGNGGRKR